MKSCNKQRGFTLIELPAVRERKRTAFTLIELPAVRERKRTAFTLIELPAVRERKRAAFTLIELILVMMIMAIVMALAAPSLRGWSRGQRLQNTADEFVAATRWARSRATADGSNYAVVIDKQSNTYKLQVQNGQTYSDADGQFAAPVTLPDGAKIDSTNDSITFYPTGRVQPATVKITADDGESITVQCATPAEDFAIASKQ